MSIQIHSPLSIEGLRNRSYRSRFTILKEIPDQQKLRAFIISYESDKLNIFARINIPNGDIPAQGFPIVVFAHGYSPNPADPAYFQREYYQRWINAYTNKGYITIMPGYRGHSIVNDTPADGFDDFTKYSGRYLTSPLYAVDVLNLLAGLDTLPLLNWSGLGLALSGISFADTKNVFLSAHSMGGDVALIVLAVSKQINATSIWAGVCADVKDVAVFYTRYYLKEHNSEKPFDIAFAAEWDKVTSAARAEPFLLDDVNQANGFYSLEHIETPFILHQGMADTAVSPEWSVNFHNRLQRHGKSSTLHLYPDNDHELSLNEAHAAAIDRDVDFFKQRLRK